MLSSALEQSVTRLICKVTNIVQEIIMCEMIPYNVLK
jgi:hypothetical protein